MGNICQPTRVRTVSRGPVLEDVRSSGIVLDWVTRSRGDRAELLDGLSDRIHWDMVVGVGAP